MSTSKMAFQDSGQFPDLMRVVEGSLSDHINSMHLHNVGDLDLIPEGNFAMDKRESKNLSSLSLACQVANLHLVTTLLAQDTDVNSTSDGGMAPIHFLCTKFDCPVARVQIAEQLIRQGVTLNIRDCSGATPLLFACQSDQIGLVEFLLKSGCNVNIPDHRGDTPFSVACRRASESWYFWSADAFNDEMSGANACEEVFPPAVICKILLRHGADARHATLLPSAVLYDTTEAVQEFIDLGMDVNLMDENGRLPLGCACSSTHISNSMIKLLLQKGADANEERGGGKSKPIISAFVRNSVDKIRLLLNYGATVSHEEMAELASLCVTKWFLENPEVVQPESKELLSWKLLVKAGFHPHMRKASVKMKHLELCSSYPQVSLWIEDFLFPMPSLKERCRTVIRAQLPPSIDDNVQELPLPNSLKGFLRFNDFFP